MEFKEFKIDLGGCHPMKSHAVQRHAFKLGYKWNHRNDLCPVNNSKRLLYFTNKGNIFYAETYHTFYKVTETQMSVEKFLELTPKDVQKEGVEWVKFYQPVFGDLGRRTDCLVDKNSLDVEGIKGNFKIKAWLKSVAYLPRNPKTKKVLWHLVDEGTE